MKLQPKKTARKAKYPFLAFRPATPLQEARIRRLAEKTGMTISDVVLECIAAHLPHLEIQAKEVGHA